MRTRNPIEAGAIALGGLLFLGGCAVAPPPSPVERDHGLSHRLAIFGQIANPEAQDNLEPVAGQEGGAALGAHKKYLGSFGVQSGGQAFTVPSGAGVTIQVQNKPVSDGLGKVEK